VLVTYLDNGQDLTVLDETHSIVVTGRSDFPWSIKGMTEAETFELLSVMVTPTDPAVKNDLIRAAANYDPGRTIISGYQSEMDADNSVHHRLADTWQAETNDFSLTYISTPVSFAPGDTQAIRLPSEALSSASGNCIELALLYASTVEAMGMQPVIVIIPGHAYLGVRVDDTSNSYYFVETTMIGQSTFDEAVTEGGTEWDEAMTHENNGDEGYGWVEVAQSRQDGILPIPWH
jgi:transglutaminase-like putative cysteine protease